LARVITTAVTYYTPNTLAIDEIKLMIDILFL
jgi:hypothetical protein